MPLGLNHKCTDRLVESLAEKLQGVHLNNGLFLNPESMVDVLECEAILPVSGKQKDVLSKYISDRPIFDFVFETFGRAIYEGREWDSQIVPIPLKNMVGYQDLKPTAKQLVAEFNSLPWQFLISFELNATLGYVLRSHMPSYIISDKIRLVRPDPSYEEKVPLWSGIRRRDKTLFGGFGVSAANPKKHEWNKETSYLQFDAEGFIGMSAKTSPIREVMSLMKSFFGLSLAINFMRFKEKGLGLMYGGTKSYYLIVHKRDNGKAIVWSTLELPQDISDTLSKLEINPSGCLDSSHMAHSIKGNLATVSTIFRNPTKAEKVLLASEWLLDSYASKNELLSFVQATVAMEILLGEKAKSDIVGIGELLRNRCAYLIGKSHSQRNEILDDFDKIYSVRSGIVHRGNSKLSSYERELFGKLQWMCSRVITEEIRLMVEDEKEAP